MKFKHVLILFVIFSLTSVVFSQRQTGSIHGVVLDEDGNPLPGATITLSGPKLMGTRSFISTSSGVFRFPALLPGEYTIKAELSGFKTLIRKGIIVNVCRHT